MVSVQSLDAYLGKHIDKICGNAYVKDSDNHCAHFVCHALAQSFGVTCKGMGNGKGPGANIRVHETFAHCRKVGAWAAQPPAVPWCLVFILNAGNVDLRRKVMSNVLNKHVGIYTAGFVWHYSNLDRKVIKQTPSEFSHHYPPPDNAMFYGTLT
ncbi:MAG: hypothetical protein U1F54_13545 [Burkholderiales bacterium]